MILFYYILCIAKRCTGDLRRSIVNQQDIEKLFAPCVCGSDPLLETGEGFCLNLEVSHVVTSCKREPYQWP